MVTPGTIHWAAGFLEGEGHFRFTGSTPQIRATQVQREPLEALERAFGGAIYRLKRPAPRQDAWVWVLAGAPAAGVMMTVFPLMWSKRSREIALSLAAWRQRPAPWKYRTTCSRGHPFDKTNTYRHGRNRHCRACGAERAKGYRDAARLSQLG